MANNNYYDISKLEDEIKEKFGDYKLLPFLKKIMERHNPYIKECFIVPSRIMDYSSNRNNISLMGVFDPNDIFVIFGEKEGNFIIFFQNQDTIIRLFPDCVAGMLRSSDNGLYTFNTSISLSDNTGERALVDERFLSINYYGQNKALEYLMNESSGLKPIGGFIIPMQAPNPIYPDKSIQFNIKTDKPMLNIVKTAISGSLEVLLEDYFEMYEEKNKRNTK